MQNQRRAARNRVRGAGDLGSAAGYRCRAAQTAKAASRASAAGPSDGQRCWQLGFCPRDDGGRDGSEACRPAQPKASVRTKAQPKASASTKAQTKASLNRAAEGELNRAAEGER